MNFTKPPTPPVNARKTPLWELEDKMSDLYENNKPRPQNGSRSYLQAAGTSTMFRAYENAHRISFIKRCFIKPCLVGVALVIPLGLAARTFAQSSSLYVTDPSQAQQDGRVGGINSNVHVEDGKVTHTPGDPRSEPIRSLSLAAVPPPEPRTYQVNDLVTIIVREQTTTDIDSSLDTEKQDQLKGEIADFPKLTLSDLANFQIKPSNNSQGTPRIDTNFDHKFEGDGQYSRSSEMSARLTARVIDVKPNGLLVLESRKFIENDDETMSLIVTGTADVQSLTADNTVLSTDLYNVHISKNTKGELRNATHKGFLTKLLEIVFNV